MSKLLQLLRNAWDNMSPRERRLASAVLALVLVCAGFTVVRGATRYVRELDNQIVSLEDAIINNAHLVAMREQVERQYQGIATQHSSAWNEAQIHDRLRQEVLRLAEKVPPELDKDGVPAQVTSGLGELVKIPKIGEGQLLEGGEGYRQYLLNFQVPDAPLGDVVAFLSRLQDSPQSLRIAKLAIMRNADNARCLADISIIRTIADLPPDAAASISAPTAKTPDDIQPGEWLTDGGTLAPSSEMAEAGKRCLRAEAQTAGAQFYTLKSLMSGEVYEFSIDITATGPCKLGIRDEEGKTPFAGEETLGNTGQPVRYRVQFAVPQGTGGRAKMRLPCLVLDEAGAQAYLDHFALKKVEVP